MRCTRAEFAHLVDLLSIPNDNIGMDASGWLEAAHDDSGLELTFNPGSNLVYICGSDYCETEEFPDAFWKAFGALLEKEGIEYMEFGVAYTCDKLIPGSHGGTSFRITKDGNVVHPIISWPDETSQK